MLLVSSVLRFPRKTPDFRLNNRNFMGMFTPKRNPGRFAPMVNKTFGSQIPGFDGETNLNRGQNINQHYRRQSQNFIMIGKGREFGRGPCRCASDWGAPTDRPDLEPLDRGPPATDRRCRCLSSASSYRVYISLSLWFFSGICGW